MDNSCESEPYRNRQIRWPCLPLVAHRVTQGRLLLTRLTISLVLLANSSVLASRLLAQNLEAHPSLTNKATIVPPRPGTQLRVGGPLSVANALPYNPSILGLKPLASGPRHSTATSAEAGLTQLRVRETIGKFPLVFEVNQGQTRDDVKFVSRGAGYTLFLTPAEAILDLRRALSNARSQGAPVGLQMSESSLASGTSPIMGIKLVGANPAVRLTGADQLPFKSNYFIGNDPAKWRTNVPSFSRVRYANLYSGVDLVFYGNQRQLECDFVVAPGADPTVINLDIDGSPFASTNGRSGKKGSARGSSLRIDPQGNLVVHTDGGELLFHKPLIYQEAKSEIGESGHRATGSLKEEAASDGSMTQSLNDTISRTQNRKYLDGRYVLRGAHTVGFKLAVYDRTQALVIDPVLSYSTYLGGTGADQASGIAVDSQGNVYITGSTQSLDFPTATPLSGANAGNSDIFVSEINASGSALLYSTYLGGSGNDVGTGIAIDAAGNAYVTGQTQSVNFPTSTLAYQTACALNSSGDCTEAFLTKLGPGGSSLAYSTYLGGSTFDQANAIALDATANVYLAGQTQSTDFPTTSGAFQTACKLNTSSQCSTAFLSKLNPAGGGISDLLYSSYLGGSTADQVNSIAVDSSGNIYLAGQTQSTDFPITNGAFQAACKLNSSSNCATAFVAQLNPGSAGASDLIYSTFLGGSTSDQASGIAVDSSANVYVGGQTQSTDFPTTPGAFQTTCKLNASNNCSEAFVTKLNPSASGVASMVYSTYLGGTGGDQANAIAVDTNGNAFVIGATSSPDFPVFDALQATPGGGSDSFVTKLNSAGTALIFSTYLGGSNNDAGTSIAVNGAGNAFVTGWTLSSDFPTASPLQPACASCPSSPDVFVAQLTGLALPVPSFSPASIDFGSLNVGATSPASTVTLSNLGDATLNITSIVAGGDFAESDNCNGSVGAGANCAISVTFAPTAAGLRSGTLTITDNAGGSPQMVSLSGVGLGSTTTAISAPTVNYNDNATVTVSVASPQGVVTGNVSLIVDANAPLNSTLVNGAAAFTLTGLNVGSHTLSASYAAQGFFVASSATSTLTVNQATPAINWPNPADITYGAALGASQLNATASVPGRFTYTPTAGALLNSGNGQSLTVNFTPSDTTDFTSASKTVYINVNQAVLFVTAVNSSRTYGAGNPTLTVVFSGFVNGDTLGSATSGAPGLGTPADTNSGVGLYPIIVAPGTLGAANYTFAFVNGTLTVTPAPLTITANNASRPQGAANPNFTGTITGLQNGDSITATYSTSATSTSAPGDCPIVPSAVGATSVLSNYSITLVNGILTVTTCTQCVLTYHNDNLRTGLNPYETILTPSNVNPNQFGKLFAYPVDGAIVGQPLYVPNVNVGGSPHNVVYVGTMHDSVYAFDADQDLGAPLWKVSFINPAAGINSVLGTDQHCGLIPVALTEVGVMPTSAIDLGTGTLYVLSKTNEHGSYFFKLHALDITTGQEQFGGPVALAGSVAGKTGKMLTFSAQFPMSRAALLLANGIIYVTFSSNGCEFGTGWVFAFGAGTLNQLGIFNTQPDSSSGGARIWQGGSGPASDSSGNVYFATGNGTFDANQGLADYGDSILKVGIDGNAGLTVLDYFTPYNQADLDAADLDLASGGVVLLPDQPGAFPHLLLGDGKGGTIYLVNRDNMGHFNVAGDSQIVQSLTRATGAVFGVPTYWNGTVYYAAYSDFIRAYSLTNGMLSGVPISMSKSKMYMPGVPSISSNGATNGILWIAGCNKGGLYAYDAANLSSQLYSSGLPGNVARDAPGQLNHFVTPMVANGRVYLGTTQQLVVYGLLPSLMSTAGDSQSAPVGTVLPIPLQVQVNDPRGGNPDPGVTITFSDGGKGGSFSQPVATTDGTGAATTIYTLPKTAGPWTVTASTSNFAPVSFSGTATPGPATKLATIHGNNQKVPVASAAPSLLTVLLTDSFGNAVPGATVTFDDGGAGGTFSASSVATDSFGKSSTSYTTPTKTGSVSLKASAPGLSPASFSLVVVAGPPASATALSARNQTAPAGSVLAHPLVVGISDQYGNPVSGITVNFSDGGAGGMFNPTSQKSTRSGRASVAYTTPNSHGLMVTVTASATGLAPVTFTITTQ